MIISGGDVYVLFVQQQTTQCSSASNLEHLRLKRILAAQISHHAGANLRRETGLDELILIVGADAVEVLLEGCLREDLERSLVICLCFLDFLGFLLIVEDLPEVLDALAERCVEIRLL